MGFADFVELTRFLGLMGFVGFTSEDSGLGPRETWLSNPQALFTSCFLGSKGAP